MVSNFMLSDGRFPVTCLFGLLVLEQMRQTAMRATILQRTEVLIIEPYAVGEMCVRGLFLCIRTRMCISSLVNW